MLVIVLDCVRAADLPPQTGHGPPMIELARWRAESIVFPKATTTGSWTLPAHASLFTGLYPWEHGVHGKGAFQLDPAYSTLAERLRAVGYRTACFSANVHISAASGLTRGFELALHGGSHDPYLRTLSPLPEPDPSGPPPDSDPLAPEGAKGEVWAGTGRGLPTRIAEYPLPWELARRAASRVVPHPPGAIERIGPWIEDRFSEWVASVPRDQPLFAFVNLLDAHEPYPVTPCRANPLDWFRWALIRQNQRSWASGRWDPSAAELDILHELYRHAIVRMDRRLRELRRALEAAGRWDGALVVLTSDHGQAFGEGGALYHKFTVEPAVARIPLWLRRPGAEDGGSSARGWASLIDVFPTVLRSAGAPPPEGAAARDLLDLVASPRPDPIYTVSEGLLWDRWPNLPESRRSRLDRLKIVACSDATCVDREWIFARAPRSATGGDSRELLAVGSGPAAEVATDEATFERIAAQLSGAVPDRLDPVVEARLAGWGY